MAVTYVVAYDITEDQRRARVAATLQALGERIQYSVFLLTIDDGQLAPLLARLATLIDLDEDSVYALRQCAPCWDARTCLGQAHPPTPQLYWAVL